MSFMSAGWEDVPELRPPMGLLFIRQMIDLYEQEELWWNDIGKDKAVPLHAMEALRGREDIAPTHSRPRH
jgi:hypothetical protein